MERFRRRSLSHVERRLRATAPEPRPEFVDATAASLAERARAPRPPRARVGLAVALSALLVAGLVALGAPSYVKAAASALAKTAKAAVAGAANGNGNGNGNGGGNGSNGNGNGGNTTICHVTGSSSNPYVEITVADSALSAHAAHGDIIPAPAGGCPGAGSGGGSGGGQYGHGIPICHSTGSATNPWVLIVVSQDAVPAHQAQGDIVPAPAGGCPSGSTSGGGEGDDTSVQVQGPGGQLAAGGSLSVTVAVASKSSTTPTPQGSVACFDGTTQFAAATLAGGSATCTESSVAAGTHTISATFSTADVSTWHSSTSAGVSVTVGPAATTTTTVTTATTATTTTAVTTTATTATTTTTAATTTAATTTTAVTTTSSSPGNSGNAPGHTTH